MAKSLTAVGVGLTLASNAALVVLMLPIATAIMAHIILGERMTKIRWLSFALAIVGVGAASGIHWQGLHFLSNRFLIGNLMVVGAIMGSSFYNTYSKKILSHAPPLQVLVYSYYVAVIFMLPLVLAIEPQAFLRVPYFSLSVWFGLSILALFDYSLAMVIFLSVLSRIDATQVGLSNYLIPFFGVALAAAVLHERLTGLMIAGGMLVLIGTMLITIWDRAAE